MRWSRAGSRTPDCQHFTGETFFQHRPPIDPSSLTRWRDRIGEEGVEWLLTKTIEAGNIRRGRGEEPSVVAVRHARSF
jgi:transposase, IS5 family